MSSTASETTPARPAYPVKRLSWHCFDCGANFSTTTRRGLRVTCPKCGKPQLGPEGIRRQLAKLEEKAAKTEQRPKREHRPPSAATPPPAAPATTPRTRTKARVVTPSSTPKPAAAQAPAAVPAEPVAPPPTDAPAVPRKSLFDRLMGY